MTARRIAVGVIISLGVLGFGELPEDEPVRVPATIPAPMVVPRCEEDEYIARRPYPGGPLVCIHVERIKADQD